MKKRLRLKPQIKEYIGYLLFIALIILSGFLIAWRVSELDKQKELHVNVVQKNLKSVK